MKTKRKKTKNPDKDFFERNLALFLTAPDDTSDFTPKTSKNHKQILAAVNKIREQKFFN